MVCTMLVCCALLGADRSESREVPVRPGRSRGLHGGEVKVGRDPNPMYDWPSGASRTASLPNE